MLVHAGVGGVGTIAIQLARDVGAEVATTASARDAALVRELCASKVIDYRETRFEDVLRDQDVALDALGGSERARSFRVLRRGGVMVSIVGFPTPAFARVQGLGLPLVAAIAIGHLPTYFRARAAGVRLEYLFMHPSGEQLAALAERVAAGAIRPIIDPVYPFERAKDALAHVETGRARGKVVLQMR